MSSSCSFAPTGPHWTIEYHFRPSFEEGFAILIVGPTRNAETMTAVTAKVQYGSWLEIAPWHEARSENMVTFAVPAKEAQSLFAELLTVKLSAVPSLVFGLDGVTHKLRIANGMSQSSYSWRRDLPSEWSEFQPYVAILEAYARNNRPTT